MKNENYSVIEKNYDLSSTPIIISDKYRIGIIRDLTKKLKEKKINLKWQK